MKYIKLIILCLSITVLAKSNDSVRISHRVIPDFVSLQTAGNIGLIAIGIGYNLFDTKIQTSIMYGYVPKIYAAKEIHSIAIRNNFRFYSYSLGNYRQLQAYFNATVLFEAGDITMLTLPSKYPDGYYGTNSFTFPLNIGIKYHTELTQDRNFDFYIEIGTLANYLYYNLVSRQYRESSIYSLSFGINVFARR